MTTVLSITPPWKDPDTGKEYKLRLLSNGDFHPEDAQKVTDGVQSFLTVVREKNPQAVMVWCIGMLGGRILPLLKQGVEQYKARPETAEPICWNCPKRPRRQSVRASTRA